MQIGFNFLLPKNIWQRFIENQNTRHRRDFIASCHVAGTFETRTQKARAAKNVSLAEGVVLSIFGSGYARLGVPTSPACVLRPLVFAFASCFSCAVMQRSCAVMARL